MTVWSSDGQVAGARRPGSWRPGAGGRVATAAVAVAIAAVASGGCAAVPTSGAVQQFGGGAQVGPAQNYSQPIVQPPGQGWTAKEIVEGFIAANASFASNPEVARDYLDPTAKKTWNPRWAVSIVSSLLVSEPVNLPKQAAASQLGAEQPARVSVTTLRVGTLTENGQPVTSSGPPKQTFNFTLAKFGGQWRISHPPPTLLLTQDAFQRVYQPRNLYFLSGSGRTLVPDPVFVPEPDTTTQLATGLVTALLQNPAGWLSGAAVTGFPAKSTVIGVKINGPNAIVDLGGKAAAGRLQQEQMAAQLAWTLASGPPSIQSVELEFNGRPLPILGTQPQLLENYSGWMPASSPGSSLYYIALGGTIKALSGIGPPGSGHLGSGTVVKPPAGTPPLRSIAVSPDGRWIAGISETGRVVYAWDLTGNARLREWASSSGPCTSLSWDQQGDLWITAGGGVWLLPPGPPGKRSATDVSPADGSVTSFQVAPDGVRAVMILSTGAPLQLVAINRNNGPSLGPPVVIGSGITDPESLSWYDANDVIVLDGSSGGQLWEVPLNGGPLTAIASQGDIVSVTATNPSGPTTNIAVGLADGQIMISSKLGAAFEKTGATGQAPAYPG